MSDCFREDIRYINAYTEDGLLAIKANEFAVTTSIPSALQTLLTVVTWEESRPE